MICVFEVEDIAVHLIVSKVFSWLCFHDLLKLSTKICSGTPLLTWINVISNMDNISNYIHDKAWGEMTYPFINFFNGATAEVWEWIISSNFIPHITGHVII